MRTEPRHHDGSSAIFSRWSETRSSASLVRHHHWPRLRQLEESSRHSETRLAELSCLARIAGDVNPRRRYPHEWADVSTADGQRGESGRVFSEPRAKPVQLVDDLTHAAGGRRVHLDPDSALCGTSRLVPDAVVPSRCVRMLSFTGEGGIQVDAPGQTARFGAGYP